MTMPPRLTPAAGPPKTGKGARECISCQDNHDKLRPNPGTRYPSLTASRLPPSAVVWKAQRRSCDRSVGRGRRSQSERHHYPWRPA
jgi:hypothetical protein